MILVTGATGLVGSHLLRHLLQKFPNSAIRAIHRSTSSHNLVKDIGNKVEWLEADVLDIDSILKALEGVNQVYHVAAMISFAPANREQMFKVNVDGTANVVNACLQLKIDKLLHVSSIAALGRSERVFEVTEENHWVNSPRNSNYAKSKYQSEMEVWRGQAEGLSTVIVNPSVILGKGDWSQGSCQLFDRVYKGLSFYPPGGTGYVDVIDLVEIMVSLMNSEIENQRFIVNGTNETFKKFLSSVAEQFSKKPPTKEVSPFLAALAWRLEAIRCFFTNQNPLITKETVSIGEKQYFYNNAKLKKTLSFNFKSLNETVSRVSSEYISDVNR